MNISKLKASEIQSEKGGLRNVINKIDDSYTDTVLADKEDVIVAIEH